MAGLALINSKSMGARVRYRRGSATSRLVLAALVFLMMLLSLLRAHAEELPQDGRLRGTVSAVTAEHNDRVANASLVLAGESLAQRFDTTSDEAGNYVFSGLPAGDYILRVQLQGFAQFEQRVSIPNSAVVEINIMLEPTGPNESVNMDTAKPAQLNTAEARVQIGNLFCMVRARTAAETTKPHAVAQRSMW